MSKTEEDMIFGLDEVDDDKNLTLIATDDNKAGKSFKVSREAAKSHSGLIRAALESDEDAPEIQLSVPSEFLAAMASYMEHYNVPPEYPTDRLSAEPSVKPPFPEGFQNAVLMQRQNGFTNYEVEFFNHYFGVDEGRRSNVKRAHKIQYFMNYLNYLDMSALLLVTAKYFMMHFVYKYNDRENPDDVQYRADIKFPFEEEGANMGG